MTVEDRHERAAPALRIGELAARTGLTTRTLRYWGEIGLLAPSGHRHGGERIYAPDDVTRATRIRELQVLLGFSLTEVRAVLDTEDVLDRVRAEFHADPTTDRRRQLLDEAIAANDRLLSRLTDTLGRIDAFRRERASTDRRLRTARAELEGADGRRASRAPA